MATAWNRFRAFVDGPIGTTIAVCLIGLQTIGGRFSYAVFQVPIQQSMGWPRSVLSLSLAISGLLMGLIAPFWGALIETFHRPGLAFLAASCLLIAGNFLFAFAPYISQAGWVVGVGLLVGTGSAGMGMSNLLAQVGRLYPAQDPAAQRKRSLLFGVVPSIGQTGQFIYTPITRALISSFGWTTAAMILGYQSLLLIPLVFFVRRKTPPSLETMLARGGSKPALPPAAAEELPSDSIDKPVELKSDDSASNSPASKPADAPQPRPQPLAEAFAVGPQYVAVPEPPTAAQAIKEAFTHTPIIFLSLAYFTCGWHIGFLGSSIPADLQDRGLSPELAAWCLSCVGIGSTVGTFLAGFLPTVIKKLRVKWMLAGIYYSRALLVTLLIVIPANAVAFFVICTILGLSWLSTVPPTTSLVASILGTRWLGTITGIMFGVHQLGFFAGTYLAAVDYDRTGSYTIVYWVTVGMALFAGTCVSFAGDRTLRRKEIIDDEAYTKLGDEDGAAKSGNQDVTKV
ncbi:major facilitator superfamily domain-containing protein [Hyaloraphidium curvatum]|nr:major facilitator superfamily domain-containing protein [Hyaloraphidium curvatum]